MYIFCSILKTNVLGLQFYHSFEEKESTFKARYIWWLFIPLKFFLSHKHPFVLRDVSFLPEVPSMVCCRYFNLFFDQTSENLSKISHAVCVEEQHVARSENFCIFSIYLFHGPRRTKSNALLWSDIWEFVFFLSVHWLRPKKDQFTTISHALRVEGVEEQQQCSHAETTENKQFLPSITKIWTNAITRNS